MNKAIDPALMQAAEEHARQKGSQWLYLDTKDDLTPAMREEFGEMFRRMREERQE